MPNQELEAARIFQTLAFQKTRTYQGLSFEQPKPPSVLTKGKVGLAEGYRPIE